MKISLRFSIVNDGVDDAPHVARVEAIIDRFARHCNGREIDFDPVLANELIDQLGRLDSIFRRAIASRRQRRPPSIGDCDAQNH